MNPSFVDLDHVDHAARRDITAAAVDSVRAGG
jgi:hypothetical protein